MNCNPPHRQPPRRRAQRAVALVVTLIMLSIITVVTITILAIVRRDRVATTQAANLTDARLAADAALERAKAEVLSQIQATTNLMGFDTVVSRSIATNVAALFADPRVPVFVDTNVPGGFGPLDPRFFLDLNRNGLFEDTVMTNGLPLLVGDPQWIGLLEKPYLAHGPNNRFLGRYAFLVAPCGKTLDVNWIHNASSPQRAQFGYFRNQGFGPWEINLAALLADLNPNVWGQTEYNYFETAPLAPNTIGAAFADSRDILFYRHFGNLANQRSVLQLYGEPGTNAFLTDQIDGYALAPAAMGGAYPLVETDDASRPWPGADSLRHYFTHQDFFDPAKVGSNFVYRLRSSSAQQNGFDDYTFYRLLSSLGTDSEAHDLSPKIHLNYVNRPVAPATLARIQAAAPHNPLNPGTTNVSPTNFVPWTLEAAPELATQFFVTVAERLFRRQFREFNPGWNAAPPYTNIFSITNIPVSPTNLYTPALHRLLQVAANLYDATRTNVFPSVFRPVFGSNTTGIYIVGFTNDNRRSTLPAWLAANRQHGIPLVFGAKKGFPNFNEFTMQTDVQVTRKLRFFRPSTNSLPTVTNQMYILGISNLFAVESWNSYEAAYPRPLLMEVTDTATVRLTNAAGLAWTLSPSFTAAVSNLTAYAWLGKQFQLPLNERQILLDPSVYRFNTLSFEPVGAANRYEPDFALPDWSLSVSNNFQYILSDGDNLVDFVISTHFNSAIDIDDTLMRTGQHLGASGTMESALVSRMWDTNRLNGSTDVRAPTLGIRNQIAVCLGMLQVQDDIWRAYQDDPAQGMDKNKAIRACQQFFQMGATQYPTDGVSMDSLEMQAPFCPTRKLIRTVTWQADDPLVHYHHQDLLMDPNSLNEFVVPPTAPVPTNMTLASIGRVNKRYAPWGGNPEVNSDPSSPTDPNAYVMAIKDPGVRSSDDWDFPNGRFPSIGWLGRVHRGTPWQTIYFKRSENEATEDLWRLQSAEYRADPAYWFRAHPTNDWALADMFITATDENSTRGLLSVNQASLPAWSALLSGVVVLTNALADDKLLSIPTNGPIPLQARFIVPAANDPGTPTAIERFLIGMSAFRQSLPEGTFSSLAQFLQVPELTIRSPWLNTASSYQQRLGLTDTAYERLPQQILSLVKSGDARFVVYAYGQSLKPADGSIDTSNGNICTNYQVTAEVATRAVIRVEGGAARPRAVIESFNVLPPD